MKRAKKIIKKPDPVEESTDGSDSEEKPKPGLKNGSGKGKMPIKLREAVKDSSYNADSDETLTQTKPKNKGKGKKLNTSTPAQESSHNLVSVSKEKPSPTKKTRKGKVALKTPAPVEDSSDNSDAEKKTLLIKKKGKGKKTLKPSDPEEDYSDNSDSDEKPRSTKKGKGKIAIKPEPMEESPDCSDTDKDPSQTSCNGKGKGKKSDKTPKPVEDSADHSETDEVDPKQHQRSLDLLSRVDPDFYKFLQKHDSELLKFDENDDPLDKEDDENDDYDDDDKVHVPGDLHGDSDESDFEAEDAKPIKGTVTLKMVKEWENELQKDGKMKLATFTHVVKLFNAAVLRATSEDGATDGEYKVAGSSVFNAVLNMCVMYLPNAIKKYLGIEQSGKDPQKCKHYVKIKGILVQYLTDLLKLLSSVTSDNILVIMLKHLHQMSKYVACFTRIAKQAIKKLLTLWSGGEETVRVLAFMCILRITRNQQAVLLEIVLKAMFMTYVKNCKFVSPSTWPGINFMRRSLVEMFTLDLDVSYPHVFLYVRQLGIHLRNAIVVPKLEHRLSVYNWQYMNSLHLWAELIQHTVHHNDMKSLHFPLVMIISNTIKLVPTPQYYPVRFLMIELLMNMAKEGGLFIPILAFFMDVITKFDINKKHKKASMKPLDFSCILRLSKSQMCENGLKDAVVEKLYALLLEYTASISHTISFPDVCVVLIIFLKDFVDKCNIANYKKKLKQLYYKIEESAEFIRNARCVYTVSFTDCKAIRAWETKIKAEGTPLITFYENWSKLNKIQKRKNVTKNDELAGAMPLIKRTKITEDAKELVKINSGTPTTLFPSDSEDEIDLFKNDDAENKAPLKEKKIKKKELQKKKKNIKQDPELDNAEAADAGDIVQEFSVSDW